MSEQVTAPSGSSATPTAGQMLRELREASGIHAAALAGSLKVPLRQLEALEHDRIDQLPDALRHVLSIQRSAGLEFPEVDRDQGQESQCKCEAEGIRVGVRPEGPRSVGEYGTDEAHECCSGG